MSLSAAPIAPYARLVAVITLGHGLIDCGRLLGFPGGAESPVAIFGAVPFWALAAFVLMRLIAAVGLWSYTTWGAVLVVAANAGELSLSLVRPDWVSLGIVGFGIRLLLLFAAVLLLVFERYLARMRANEL